MSVDEGVLRLTTGLFVVGEIVLSCSIETSGFQCLSARYETILLSCEVGDDELLVLV